MSLKCGYYLVSGSGGMLLLSQQQGPFMRHLLEREGSAEVGKADEQCLIQIFIPNI